MDRANFHSTLSGNLSVIREMGGHSISCGSTGTKSNNVDLDSILIRGIYNACLGKRLSCNVIECNSMLICYVINPVFRPYIEL